MQEELKKKTLSLWTIVLIDNDCVACTESLVIKSVINIFYDNELMRRTAQAIQEAMATTLTRIQGWMWRTPTMFRAFDLYPRTFVKQLKSLFQA